MKVIRKLSHLTEDKLVSLLTSSWPSTYSSKKMKILRGVGDDCAVLKNNTTNYQLFKTDAIVEDIHFTSETPNSKIGWKALARCTSDIAAMGGTPTCALITLGISKNEKLKKIQQIYQGIQHCAQTFEIALVGGETSQSPALFLSIAMLGIVKPQHLVLRSGAKPNQAICVTGTLGGSIKDKHLNFTPRLLEAQWLVNHYKPSAMMDISDGLATDLPRLCKESNVGYQLEENKIPKTTGCTLKQALCDGEDFELLFTLPKTLISKLQKKWPFKTKLSVIGITTDKKTSSFLEKYRGFDHLQQR